MYIRRHTTQPQYQTAIDYTGLGRGVQLIINPALGPIDLVTGRVWTPSGNTNITISQKGKVFGFDGVDDGLDYTGYQGLANEGTFFAFLPRVGTADVFGHIYLGSNSPNVHIFLVNSDGSIWIGANSHGNISPASWFNTTNRSIAMVSSPTKERIKAFIDGKTVVSFGAVGEPGWGAGDRSLRFGGYRGGANWDFDGTMLIAGYTSSVWGESEATAFHENPWQLFKMSSRRSRSIISIGGSSYTISPSGSLVLSGSASHIKTKIFLPTGNINFSGNSRLIKEKIISPQGTISLSGNNPVIKTKIVNASGTISFTGTTPVIRSKIIESSGGINFSGTASLSGAVSYILTPIGGLTFNGSSSLIKTHIQIPTGKISFSGNSPIESNTVIITVSTRLPLTGVGK